MTEEMTLIRLKISILGRCSGLIGVWIYILFFSEKTSAHVGGGIIGTFIILSTIICLWVQKVILSPETIIIKRILTSRSIQVKDIFYFEVKKTRVECVLNKGSKYYIPLDGFNERDTDKIKEYIKNYNLEKL